MSTSIFRPAVAAAVVASLAGAPPALARGPVFGGATTGKEPIVIGTDAKAKKLKSAVVAWRADCKGGGYWADNAELRAVQSGFVPRGDDLTMSRNGRGRFSGTQLYASDVGGGMRAAVVVKASGRMTAKRATGTLRAVVTITDAQGSTQDACDTGALTWQASRAPGRVFGGATSQHEPVVVRVDRGGRNVSDLMFTWYTQQCTPDAFIAMPESLTGFAIRSHRFGDAFSNPYKLDDGSTVTFDYDVSGKIGRTASSGSLRVTITQTDPSGAQTMACDSGAISWRASTG